MARNTNNKWGFLRETKELADKAGIDKDTGIKRTGLDEYLAIIYPRVTDWTHDKAGVELNGKKLKTRPDYRSETLKMIIEFDGLPHYTKPDVIKKDEINTKDYEDAGYEVIRIPYLIQLSNNAVATLFGVKVSETLFDEQYPSLGVKGKNTPAYPCHQGVIRMAKDFKKFHGQYITNLNTLSKEDDFLTGLSLLQEEYNKL